MYLTIFRFMNLCVNAIWVKSVCILVFYKELGLCGMTNLNSNPDPAFSLLCDLEPSIVSLWASVSLSLYVCNYTAYVCVCMKIHKYEMKKVIFLLTPFMWELCIWILYMTEHYIINSFSFCTKCLFNTLLWKMWPPKQVWVFVKWFLPEYKSTL